jgi:c-di-GMP-binding flagellar brake protein YcgR
MGYHKYLFNTTIKSVSQQGCLWRILLEIPDKAERIQRRMYHRQAVPKTMNVKVTFWHRGYLNEDSGENLNQGYWQGQLLNLSAGGAQFEIASDDQAQFKMGQLLGIQFTPLSYQKPLVLDSHIRYLKEQPDTNSFKVGVEFLGLTASPDGKETLSRILEVIDQYEKSNSQNLSDTKKINV